MSRLYYTESGNVIPSLGEELTHYRRVRKILTMPATSQPGTLFFLARAYPENQLPLRILANGIELSPLAPQMAGHYCWHEVPVPVSALRTGTNLFEFWTDAEAMDAWSLALEDGHREPGSLVSSDGGATWRDGQMGYLNVARGEYIVRMRLAEGQDPIPPAMAWEELHHPRLKRLCEMLPVEALRSKPTLGRVQALNTWVSTCWRYRNSNDTPQYAPWDAATIMSWGKAERGHDGRPPAVMCVHYGVALVTCCLAIGIPARGAIFTGSINGWNGHYTAEVWMKEYQKWVMVDPTKDAILFRDGVPMSVSDIRQMGDDLLPFVKWGPGRDFQGQNEFLESWISDNFRRGVYYQHRSVWPRADFLSHPELTPPGHGSTSYCETNLVWEEKDLDQGFGMFPYFAGADYFDAPPAWE